MTRICGITGQAPREGEGMRIMRVQPEDAEELKTAIGLSKDIDPGLYQVNLDTFDAYRPIVARRLGMEESGVSKGMMT